MTDLVSTVEESNYHLIRMDDGKANALSFDMIEQVNAALDRAEAAAKTVVLSGRPGKFSAGFDLSIMSQGGVPIVTAMEIASAVCGNRVLERSLLQAKDRIMAGSGIAESLGQDRHFPRLVVRMVGVGERSGRLPEVLDKVSDAYENQVEGSVVMAMSLAEPIFICFFGVLILVMVLAIYMPIFTVSSNV